MGNTDKPKPGTVGWFDLTVANAEEVKAFYEAVVGWKAKAHPMGDYDDYEMQTADGQTVAGVCHRRGVNAGIPSHWLLYVTVANLEASLKRCKDMGGEVTGEVRDAGGYGRLCIVRDPAGAAIALIEAAS